MTGAIYSLREHFPSFIAIIVIIATNIENYTKAFDCVGHNKLWKLLKEMGIPDHLTCLLRNLYVGQEAN